MEEAIALIQSLPGNGNTVTLESLQAQRDAERKLYCQELESLAKLFVQQDAERKRLWGTKYPRVHGQKPPEDSKPINPVKMRKAKQRRASDKGSEVGTPPVTRKKS